MPIPTLLLEMALLPLEYNWADTLVEQNASKTREREREIF